MIRAVTHEGLAGASRGTFLSHRSLARQGGDNSWVGKHTSVHMGPHVHTPTPGLTPAQTSQLQACRAGEGGGQGPHSGWLGKPSQDHTEQKSCPETHGYFNWKWAHWTPPGSQALNHHKPPPKEDFLISFSLLCLHYLWTSKRAECDADAVNIRDNQVHHFRSFF